jgi:hypothetical protein
MYVCITTAADATILTRGAKHATLALHEVSDNLEEDEEKEEGGGGRERERKRERKGCHSGMFVNEKKKGGRGGRETSHFFDEWVVVRVDMYVYVGGADKSGCFFSEQPPSDSRRPPLQLPWFGPTPSCLNVTQGKGTEEEGRYMIGQARAKSV